MTDQELEQQYTKIVAWPAQLRKRSEVEVLHEFRARLHSRMNTLFEEELTHNRNLNEDEQRAYDDLGKKYVEVSEEIARSPKFDPDTHQEIATS